MSWVAVGVGTMTLINGINQAANVEQQGRLQSQINELNAKYADIDAFEAEQFGLEEVAQYQGQIEDVIGAQRVGYASQNVDVSFGTAAEVQAETRLTGFLNAADMAAEGRARALGLRRQAGNMRLNNQMQQGQTALNASAIRSTAVINAVGTGAKALGPALTGYSKGK